MASAFLRTSTERMFSKHNIPLAVEKSEAYEIKVVEVNGHPAQSTSTLKMKQQLLKETLAQPQRKFQIENRQVSDTMTEWKHTPSPIHASSSYQSDFIGCHLLVFCAFKTLLDVAAS